ncbi:hypothetical protein DFP73DRAFT_553344 [Morchella snyderi]|nr:hypothetical protein DFP73DRAFT_553344 [Morchella snyderi]
MAILQSSAFLSVIHMLAAIQKLTTSITCSSMSTQDIREITTSLKSWSLGDLVFLIWDLWSKKRYFPIQIWACSYFCHPEIYILG